MGKLPLSQEHLVQSILCRKQLSFFVSDLTAFGSAASLMLHVIVKPGEQAWL
jgi:hypothetical protein